ncbi:polysaccharide deacetylase family protein [Roseivivax marinus]|uniref:polysaccharide deacetylase family protein n=1 Tax=Roseivivax marinus TaxID=1379903 RepID=UPI001F035DF2|nr:polysaccharide deacetylase family protein [Roseivivax marinus]UMA63665.1 polysaccharide deacetylase family protein [Roseivivax marinus]
MSLPHHGRFDYVPITRRQDFTWPEGKRLAVYFGINLEHFSFGEGRGAQLVPKGNEPDVLNYAWRDYGNRVGAWRLIETFDALDLPATVLANSTMYDHAPELMAAHRDRGDEIAGHGRTNAERQDTMSEPEERAMIAEATEVLTRAEGRAPGGWLSPWIAESFVTPDLLAEAGYRYTLNWCMDDQPIWMRTRAGPLLSVPYPQEVNDIPSVVARTDTADTFAAMILDDFEERLAQSREQSLVMGIALHPYIVGQPYRLRALRRVLERIAGAREEVWITRAGDIAAECHGRLRDMIA